MSNDRLPSRLLSLLSLMVLACAKDASLEATEPPPTTPPPDCVATGAESCDGVDNDCDGRVDEDFNVGLACDGDDTDVAREGVFACVSSTASACDDADIEETGAWDGPFSWPSSDLQTEAVHLIQLPNGWVYSMYHGSDIGTEMDDHFPNAYDAAALWNPTTGVAISVPLLDAGEGNLFCSGHNLLADGRVLFTGGDVTGASPAEGVDTSYSFDGVPDPTGGAYSPWAEVGHMVGGVRWYPNNTTLADGSVLITSGATVLDPYTINDAAEVYLPGPDRFELRAPREFFDMYPWMFVLPDGRLLSSGQEAQASVWDPVTDVWSDIAEERDSKRVYGTSAMLLLDGGDPDSAADVLIAGGCKGRLSPRCCLDTLVTDNFDSCEEPDPEPGSDSWECFASAELLTGLTGGTPTWEPVGDMADERGHGVATLLPDGTVIVTGGERNDCTPAPQPEIYHPDTRAFTLAAPYPSDLAGGSTWPGYRGDYHTSAILLPDARVLITGGDTDSLDADGPTAWIYRPPYLDRVGCPQPVISAAPDRLIYGNSFTISVDTDEIDHLVLMRLGAMTHDFNMDQRGVRLDVTGVTASASDWDITATAPVTSALAPPGPYLLFALSADDVPSVAKIVQVVAGDCATTLCYDPPASQCTADGERRVFDSEGTCFEGSCQYASTLESCRSGCSEGACR